MSIEDKLIEMDVKLPDLESLYRANKSGAKKPADKKPAEKK